MKLEIFFILPKNGKGTIIAIKMTKWNRKCNGQVELEVFFILPKNGKGTIIAIRTAEWIRIEHENGMENRILN